MIAVAELITQRLPCFPSPKTGRVRDPRINSSDKRSEPKFGWTFIFLDFFVSFRCNNCFCIWDCKLHHAWVCFISMGSWTSLYRILGVAHTSFGYTLTSGLHCNGFTDVVLCCSVVCDEFISCSVHKERVCYLSIEIEVYTEERRN